ncbi:VWA domain-containing protein [Micrococcus terreus]|uniref:vWA domain-containing protein n=1 Tax=Micrococcus terreus TaxID=574650 RepID=UPI0033D27772
MTADPQTTAAGNALRPVSRLSRRRPLALGLSLALAGLALPTGPAVDTPSATPDQPEPGTGGSTQQPVVVVMDYSSSMLEADADASGTTRIDAAKDATKQLISDTPDDARLGLVVYGNNTPQDCRDISTLHEVGPVDAGALNSQIDALEAVGETPIGASLLHAAEDLKDEEGEKSIILVSDGEPNCNEPPACEAAQETLRCIAEATGGTFTEADDAGSLTEQLRIQTTRAFQGYEAEGDEVTGGTNVAGAVELLPGQYVTELTSGERPIGLSSRTWPEGSVQFFSAPHQQGYFTNVSATLVLPRAEQKFDDDALIAVQPVGTCETGRGYEMSYPGSEDAHPVGTWRSAEATLDERDQERCLTPEVQQVFAVYREGDFQPDTALPVEITVAYEKQEDGLPESADHTAAERTPGA